MTLQDRFAKNLQRHKQRVDEIWDIYRSDIDSGALKLAVLFRASSPVAAENLGTALRRLGCEQVEVSMHRRWLFRRSWDVGGWGHVSPTHQPCGRPHLD